jgi:thiol-disulfide isomerase/thioredoxin
VKRILLAVVLLGGVAAAVWAVHRAGQVLPLSAFTVAGAPTGQRVAPGFVGQTLDGRELALSELRGRPVVMNFWASWCAPCRLEKPILAAAARKHADSVHFIGVNVLDGLQDAQRFAQEFDIPYPSLYDDDGSLLRAYQVVGLPTTVFVTADGRISGAHRGPFVGAEGTRRLEDYLLTLRRH